MRRGMVSLWDVAGENEVGVGFVEHSHAPNVVCRHKWVLDCGYRFAPSGLTYAPQDGSVALDEAEAILAERWQPDSRLVVCEARVLPMPNQTNLEKAGKRRRPAGGSAGRAMSPRERIELKGVWAIHALEEPLGFVFVPDVEEFSVMDAEKDPSMGSTSLLQGMDVQLLLQNKYVEHWVLEGSALPLLDQTVTVLFPQGQAPLEVSFFEQMAERMKPKGSYTEVLCGTWIQQGA